jgi:hypothetical protein
MGIVIVIGATCLLISAYIFLFMSMMFNKLKKAKIYIVTTKIYDGCGNCELRERMSEEELCDRLEAVNKVTRRFTIFSEDKKERQVFYDVKKIIVTKELINVRC